MSDDRAVVHRRATGLRVRSTRETLAIAERQALRLGITRVTEITRLDRLGVPVFSSVRPRGLVLQVHAGKGWTAIDARLGALMEAIEYAVTELHGSRVQLATMTLSAVVAQFDGRLHWMDLAPPVDRIVSPRRAVRTVRCEVLGQRHAPVWMPAELVFAPYREGRTRPVFGWSTNGVASGSSLDEASLHALFEVLERDAVAIHAARDASRWVVRSSLPSSLRARQRRWRIDGVTLAVRELPNLFRLPCFAAYLFEAMGDGARIAAGTGLHADRSIALGRAVSEAAQSRLSMIHGAREDVTRLYGQDPAVRRAREDVLVARVFDRSRRVALHDVAHVSLRGRSLTGLLDEMLERVHDAGFAHVLRYRFRRSLGGLRVVRIIVPGCEEVGGIGRRAGPRLMMRLLGDA